MLRSIFGENLFDEFFNDPFALMTSGRDPLYGKHAKNLMKTDVRETEGTYQLDVDLLDKIGEEFYRIFKDDGVNKILTIEASGIAIACMTARHFDVPVVFAKKAKSKNIDGDVYTSTVHSYTYGKDYNITLSQKFLGPNDRVLILDDFLANGKAMRGLLDVCQQAGASVAGIGICIEKGFQPGGDELRREGYKLASLAIVDEMGDNGSLKFRETEY